MDAARHPGLFQDTVDCHFLLQGLPNPGIEPRSPAFDADSLLSVPPGKPICMRIYISYILGYVVWQVES